MDDDQDSPLGTGAGADRIVFGSSNRYHEPVPLPEEMAVRQFCKLQPSEQPPFEPP